jgi:hypothetical protein
MLGGLSFVELNAYLEVLAQKGEIVGFDFDGIGEPVPGATEISSESISMET